MMYVQYLEDFYENQRLEDGPKIGDIREYTKEYMKYTFFAPFFGKSVGTKKRLEYYTGTEWKPVKKHYEEEWIN